MFSNFLPSPPPLPPTFVCSFSLAISPPTPRSTLTDMYSRPSHPTSTRTALVQHCMHILPRLSLPLSPPLPITYSYLSSPPPAFARSSPSVFVYYSSVVNAVHLLHDITSPCNLWSFLWSVWWFLCKPARKPSLASFIMMNLAYCTDTLGNIPAVKGDRRFISLSLAWLLDSVLYYNDTRTRKGVVAIHVRPRGSVDLCDHNYDLACSCTLTPSVPSWRWW